MWLNLPGPIFRNRSSETDLPKHDCRIRAAPQAEPTPPEYATGRRITHFFLPRAGYITDATGIKA
jgi:hypothetical protein